MRARRNKQKKLYRDGCSKSFFLVLLTVQNTLITAVGLQQLIQIERGPAVLSGREAILIKKFYERILSVTRTVECFVENLLK